jgi:hypothetical protein
VSRAFVSIASRITPTLAGSDDGMQYKAKGTKGGSVVGCSEFSGGAE